VKRGVDKQNKKKWVRGGSPITKIQGSRKETIGGQGGGGKKRCGRTEDNWVGGCRGGGDKWSIGALKRNK